MPRVPLLDHIAALLHERDVRFQQRFDATERAIQRADEATEKRFASVNEFRSTLADQAREFLPRAEFSQARDANLDRFTRIESRLDNLAGQTAGKVQSWGILIGAMALLGTLFTVVNFFITHGVKP